MRLKSGIWVSAYLRRCAVENVPAVVVKRGHEDAGAIFIEVDRLDGTLNLYAPAPAGLSATEAERFWVACFGGEAANAQAVAEYLARQEEFDPDLWVIAVEDKEGRHFLGDALIAA
ncbi:DUF1491 family protein [Methyloceanibacter caenitepidi]|uniref:Mlr7652 protein n=1 Tax=Methyloceanibacter caenitepidi TaxID=1384459 RepID=A0A0A8K7P0_9HYPH|nr:DUF1491 family protein [Methyloceanibacter caenitepidi]BAQ18019.1 Mlr7652 protein [Methyloceanibacter caenitepidi]